MIFIDEKFRKDPGSFYFQSILATLAIFVTMCVLDVFTQTTIIATMGASCFILFAMPKTEASNARRVIGGYIIGTIIGIGCWYVSEMKDMLNYIPSIRYLDIMTAAIAVGLTIFVMAVSDSEHPPAAGLAMAFVFNPWDNWTITVVIGGISLLVGIKQLMIPHLKNLI